MPFDPISIALGAGEAAVGLINSGKANKRADELAKTRPKLQSSPYLKDQLSLAESELSTGMSAEAKNAYEQDMDRSLSSSLGALTRMGGSPNDVGSVFANNANGRARLAVMKDNLRMTQINNLVRAQDASEEEREKEFQFNEWAPWADASQANAQAKSAARSEIFGGLNTLGGGLMRGFESGTAKKETNAYFSAPNVNAAPTTTGYSSPASTRTSINPNSAPNYLDSLIDPINND